MHRRALLRAGLVAGFASTAGCLDAVDRITWNSGAGSLHRPGAVRLDDRDPADGAGIAAVLTARDELDRIEGDETPVTFTSETDLSTYGLVIVQISRPAADAAAIRFGPGGLDRSGLRGLSVTTEIDPWDRDLPEEVADAETLEYTNAIRFERPSRLVPQSATVSLVGADGDRIGRLEAD